MTHWYRLVEGQEVGPLLSSALKQLADAGQLQPDDRVRRSDMTAWCPAKQVKGLFSLSEKNVNTQGANGCNSQPNGRSISPASSSDLPPKLVIDFGHACLRGAATSVSMVKRSLCDSRLLTGLLFGVVMSGASVYVFLTYIRPLKIERNSQPATAAIDKSNVNVNTTPISASPPTDEVKTSDEYQTLARSGAKSFCRQMKSEYRSMGYGRNAALERFIDEIIEPEAEAEFTKILKEKGTADRQVLENAITTFSIDCGVRHAAELRKLEGTSSSGY